MFGSRVSQYQALLHDLTSSVKFDSQNRITNLPDTTTSSLDYDLDHAPKRTHTLTPK